MPVGKTIQIFLPDGNPRGVKIAEITSRTVQAVFLPRSEFNKAANRDELDNVGIYFLIGSSEDEGKPLLYVGEAENCRDRLASHHRRKDFWNVAIAVVSKTAHLTKSHVKYLEWYCCEQAKKAGRYALENTNIPTKAHIPEPVEADLLDNFDTFKVLVATLGHPIFDKLQVSGPKDTLICEARGAYAEGQYTEEGLVVLAGSKCALRETGTARPAVLRIRTELIEQGILIEKDGAYVFTQDHVFASPSGAARVVKGRNSNGWKAWKYKNGKTLDEVKRRD